MKNILFLCCAAWSAVLWGKEFKSGTSAVVHKIDKESKTITVAPAFSAGSAAQAGKKVYNLHWSNKTQIFKQHTVDFSSLKPGQIVWLLLTPQEAKKVKQGKNFICRRMVIEAERHSRLGFRSAGKLCAPVYPAEEGRGEIEYAGKRIKFKAPGKVTVRTVVSPENIKSGNMVLQIFGTVSENKFNISHIVINTQEK